MKKSKISLNLIAEIAIFAALGFVLDLVQGSYSKALFANGGAIGIAMIVVLIISFRRGALAGFITGLIIGFVQLSKGFYVVSDLWWKNLIQVGLDYIFAYAVIFVSGYFRPLYFKAKTKTSKGLFLALGSIVGCSMKYLSHFLSGILFWPDGHTGFARVTYSLTYNGGYMIPSIILCTVLFVLIILAHPQFVLDDELVLEKSDIKHETIKLVTTIVSFIVGISLMVIFLVLFIRETSFVKSDYEFTENHLGRAPTYMINVIIGISFILVGVYYLIGYIKKYSQSLKALYMGLYTLSIGSILGALNYIFIFSYKVYKKGKNPVDKNYDNPAYYLVWLIFGLIVLLSTVICNFKIKEEI